MRHTDKVAVEDKWALNQILNGEEIVTALKEQPNGKAARMDGIPCELWKTLQNQYELSGDADTPEKANTGKMLTAVFNNMV
jgi:plasmid maintenance system antidote protein VapI